VTCRFARSSSDTLLILACGYDSVSDDDYIDEPEYGALIGSGAFRKAMQIAYSHSVGLFHVHMHGGRGSPKPSSIDTRESQRFVPDFFNVQPRLQHGILILSSDWLWGQVWVAKTRKPEIIQRITVVGDRLVRGTA